MKKKKKNKEKRKKKKKSGGFIFFLEQEKNLEAKNKQKNKGKKKFYKQVLFSYYSLLHMTWLLYNVVRPRLEKVYFAGEGGGESYFI